MRSNQKKRTLWLLAPGVLALAVSGCSTHSIRDGIWELSFNVEGVDHREPLPIPKREARVVVGWTEDLTKPDVHEILEISAIEQPSKNDGEKPARLPREPMYGEIETRDEHDPIVRIVHNTIKKDKDWTWQMQGVVADSRTIVGTYFFGRLRNEPNTSFEGGKHSWSMRWLRDG